MFLGYSGSDITLVCKEAAMSPLRVVFKALEMNRVDEDDLKSYIEHIKVPSVTMKDLLEAIQKTNPSSNDQFRQKYAQWQNDFGST